MHQLLICHKKLSKFLVLFYKLFLKILTFRGKKWAFWRKQLEHINICFSSGFQKNQKCASFFKNNVTTMKIKDRRDKILVKNFYFKSILKNIFFNVQKINLNFVLLKFSPFLASQEFFQKSTLQPWFEAYEAEGSRVERPEFFFGKWHFWIFLWQNFDF